LGRFALNRQLPVGSILIIALVILGSSITAAQPWYQAKIRDQPLFPPTVRVNDHVSIQVIVWYSFPPAVPVPTRVRLLEVEATTGKALGVLDASPPEPLEGEETRRFSLSTFAPAFAKLWLLRVQVQYQVGYTWTNDAEGWFRDFSIEVKGLDFKLELQGLVPNSQILVDSTSQAVASSGTFATTLAAGIHVVELAGTVEVSPGTRRVFKEWKDGYQYNSRQVTLSTDTTLYVTYETQCFLSVDSREKVTLVGQGWYKEGSTATISLDPTEVQVEGILGLLGARRMFDRWIGDDYQTIARTPSAAVMIRDRPQTVRAEWRTDYGYVYINMGIMTAVIIVIIAVLLMISRRKPPPPRPIITGTSYGVPLRPAPVVPPLLRVQPVRERKFCTQCGAEMDAAARRCPACGHE